jgi:small subunit ribosomal protein S9
VCWKGGSEWVVGVEVRDDISQDSSISVLQDNVSLSEDGSRAGCWPLAKLNTAVTVQIVDSSANQTLDIPLGDNDWLIFKLSGRGLNQGRRVKRVWSGSYVAIVPDTWARDEEKAGNEPTTPEPVFLEGYLAHFFELTEDVPPCIAFRDDEGKPIIIGSGGPHFYLAGQQVQDASEGIGPLFGGQPPRICVANGQWSDVETIVVGQEGSGRQRWRESFEPKADQAEQELPHEVLETEAGWYFLRFYDGTDTLIDSLDFRFVAGLKGILIPPAGPAPGPDGHVSQTVEILHDAGYSVTQAAQECPGLRVERRTDKTILTVPPTPGCDCTRWFIRPPNNHGREVELTILIERVWWALGCDDKEPVQWEDRPLGVTPEYFAAASSRALWVRLPKPRWVSDISAGFRRERSRKFHVKVSDSTVPIPLRDFAGVQELDDRAAEHAFKVWLETGQGTHEVTVAILSAVAQATPFVCEWGRHKTAIAEARLQTGSGKINVNGASVHQYLRHAPPKAHFFVRRFLQMPAVHQALSNLDVDVTVLGSGPTTIRQAKAVVHAIARALWRYDHELMRPLKRAGFGGASVRRKHRPHWARRVNDESR